MFNKRYSLALLCILHVVKAIRYSKVNPGNFTYSCFIESIDEIVVNFIKLHPPVKKGQTCNTEGICAALVQSGLLTYTNCTQMQQLHHKIVTDDDIKFWHDERGYFSRIAARAMQRAVTVWKLAPEEKFTSLKEANTLLRRLKLTKLTVGEVRASVEQFVAENPWTLGLTTLLEIMDIDEEEFMGMVEKMESENMKLAYKDLSTIRTMLNLATDEDDFVGKRTSK